MDLPDDLVLPLESGAPYWYWLGTRPALDFVNTLRERWWRRVECLCTPADLGAWLVQAGLVVETAEVDQATLGRARSLREAIDAAVSAAIEGTATPISAVRMIDSWLVAAATPFELRVDDGTATLAPRAPGDPVRAAIAQIALDAATMLGTAERSRLRVCASDTCSARFFDRSPGANRRWCSMGACGNREKVRRHRSNSPARDEQER